MRRRELNRGDRVRVTDRNRVAGYVPAALILWASSTMTRSH
jgi:hypothetical protein